MWPFALRTVSSAWN